jgi:hypothetical protein
MRTSSPLASRPLDSLSFERLSSALVEPSGAQGKHAPLDTSATIACTRMGRQVPELQDSSLELQTSISLLAHAVRHREATSEYAHAPVFVASMQQTLVAGQWALCSHSTMGRSSLQAVVFETHVGGTV